MGNRTLRQPRSISETRRTGVGAMAVRTRGDVAAPPAGLDGLEDYVRRTVALAPRSPPSSVSGFHSSCDTMRSRNPGLLCSRAAAVAGSVSTGRRPDHFAAQRRSRGTPQAPRPNATGSVAALIWSEPHATPPCSFAGWCVAAR
jgi:hypothetical protein